MSQYRIKNKKKPKRLKKRYVKKKPLWKKPSFRIALELFIALVLAAYLFLFSPLLAIENVTITTPDSLNYLTPTINEIVNQGLQQRFVVFSLQKTFFLLNTSKIKEKIKQIEPSIEEVVVKKSFSNTLSIELKERTPRALWCYAPNENCWLIDQKGVIYKASGQKNLPVILIENQRAPEQTPIEAISPDKMARILETFGFFNETLKINVQFIATDANETLNVKTQEGWETRLILGEDIKVALTKLKLLIETNMPEEEQRKTLEYMDLRFSKVYYK